jgi:hypothetical protein
MEHPQSFSPGLLYSVAPEDFAQLHLNDESRLDDLDWDEGRSRSGDESYAKTVLAFLKVTAVKWGLIRNDLH